jgi:hypothetical protein
MGCRARVPRHVVGNLLARRVRELSYQNFKASVLEEDLHDLYLTWWVGHRQLQSKSFVAETAPAPKQKSKRTRKER